MSIINVSNLTFSYDKSYDNIFESVSFALDTNWKTGFIGRNGRGKTTFLNLLMGKYEYSGNISTTTKFDYFPFDMEDKSLNTIDIIQNISDSQLWQLNRELSLLQVSEDVLYRPFNTLSNGEQTKVLLAALFLNDNRFLLIDEPTNHLDTEARIIVSNYLKLKKGFILISHDRNFLDNCVDHILSINKTDIDIQKGNFSSWRENKKNNDNFEQAENEKLKSQIKHLSAAAKQTASWSERVEKSKHKPLSSGLSADKGYIGHKSAKMMKRSKVTETRMNKAIDDKSKLLNNIETADDLKLSPLKFHSERLINLTDISIYYNDKKICQDIIFEINRGDRISVSGKNGSGKSSLLKLISGETIKYTGTLESSKNLIISYVSQDTSHLGGYLKEFAVKNNIDESLFKTILRKLDFSRIQFDKDISDYSGGQKKKVLLAKSLAESAHLYIWDEPLNFIDLLSRIQIEDVILKYCPTMVFVEHDKIFRTKISTKIITI